MIGEDVKTVGELLAFLQAFILEAPMGADTPLVQIIYDEDGEWWDWSGNGPPTEPWESDLSLDKNDALIMS